MKINRLCVLLLAAIATPCGARILNLDAHIAPVVTWNFIAQGSLPGWTTLTRASTGSYYNSSGVLSSAATNVARFDYDPQFLTLKGLLYEDSRINVATQSSMAAFTTNGVTISAAPGNSPDGTTDATKILATAGSSEHILYNGPYTVTASIQYSASMYIKFGNYQWNTAGMYNPSTWHQAVIDLTNNVIGTIDAGGSNKVDIARMQPVGNGWYRVSVVVTMASGVNGSYIGTRLVSGNNTTLVWTAAGTEFTYVFGAQEEINTFPSSYIPTTTGTVTRSADVLTVPAQSVTGPTIIETQDEGTGIISRSSYAANAFVWPVNVWVRSMAIYPAGTSLGYLSSHLGAGVAY